MRNSPNNAAASDNLAGTMIHGLKWSYFSTVINIIFQMGFSAIMARLLAPASFGLIAMALFFLRFGSYFSTMGLSQAVIQRSELTNEDIRTAFTASMVLGIAFALFITLLAPLAKYVFDQPDLINIIRALALSFIIAGLSNTSLGLLRRQLRFKAMALVDITGYVFCYGGLGVYLAWRGYGVWSLVIAILAQGGYQALLAYTLTRHDLRPAMNSKSWREMSAYGGKTSLIGFMEFVGASLDTIIIGRILGAERLGHYNRAQMLSNVPAQYFTTSFSRVLFPAITCIQYDTERLKKAYLKSLQLLSFILLPAYVGISIAANPIVHFFLGNRWIMAIPVLSILALAVPLSMLSHLGGIICDATGKLKAKLQMQLIYVILSFLLFVILGRRGLKEAAICVFLVEFFRFIAYFIIINKIMPIHFLDWVWALKSAVIAMITVSISVFAMLKAAQVLTSSSVLQLAFVLIVGMLTILVLLSTAQNRLLRGEFIEKIRLIWH